LIEALAECDEAEAAVALAEAFRDNPLNRAVIGSDDPIARVRSNEHGMRVLLPTARRHGLVRTVRHDGAIAGVLIASPPGTFPLPPSGLVSRLRLVFQQGWQVSRRWGEVFDTLAWLHPAEPHWYLGTLGIAPPHQRRGLGRALLRDWLPGVDRDGVIAYLETDGEHNVGFYGSVGFEVEAETDVLGVRVWRMRRPPPTAPAALAD
jgi:ribosomal protein S18 acetylase RimI-like enzyme